MACANTIPISIETRDVLDRFSNYLFARAGYAQATVDLTVGFVRRMAPVIGLDPSREDVDRYIADMRRRGSLATALLDRGASIYSIQALLGHTFTSTTMEYYLHPSARNVRSDYLRCVPSYV